MKLDGDTGSECSENDQSIKKKLNQSKGKIDLAFSHEKGSKKRDQRKKTMLTYNLLINKTNLNIGKRKEALIIYMAGVKKKKTDN